MLRIVLSLLLFILLNKFTGFYNNCFFDRSNNICNIVNIIFKVSHLSIHYLILCSKTNGKEPLKNNLELEENSKSINIKNLKSKLRLSNSEKKKLCRALIFNTSISG